jgi:hypothetical protein
MNETRVLAPPTAVVGDALRALRNETRVAGHIHACDEGRQHRRRELLVERALVRQTKKKKGIR